MELWVCTACEGSVHARCFGSSICECPCARPPEHWLTPERRTELRRIATEGMFTLHLPVHERVFIEGLVHHRNNRQEAEARRG